MDSLAVKIITAVVLIIALAFGAAAVALNWDNLVSGATLYTATDLQREKDASFAEGAGSVSEYTSEITRLKQALTDKEAAWTKKYNALWDEYRAEVTRLNGEIQRLEALVDVMFVTMSDYFDFDLKQGTPTADALNMQLQFFQAMKENAELSIARETETLAHLPDMEAEKAKMDELIAEAVEAEKTIQTVEKLHQFVDTVQPADFTPMQHIGDEGEVRFSFNQDEYNAKLREFGLTEFRYGNVLYSTEINAYQKSLFPPAQIMPRVAIRIFLTVNYQNSAAWFLEKIWTGRYYSDLGNGTVELSTLSWEHQNAVVFYYSFLNSNSPTALADERAVIEQRNLQQQIYDGYLQQKAISEYLINAHTSNLTDKINPYITELEERIAELKTENNETGDTPETGE